MWQVFQHILKFVAMSVPIFALTLGAQCIGKEVHAADNADAAVSALKPEAEGTQFQTVAKAGIPNQSEDLISGKRSLLMSKWSGYSRGSGSIWLRPSGDTRGTLRSIDRTRQNLNRSMQSITNSVRSMNSSINAIRTYRRRF